MNCRYISKKILILIAFLAIFLNGYAQESDDIEKLASETWKIILKELEKKDIPFERKISLINEFIARSPENSTACNEAKLLLEKVENSGSRLEHYLNRNLYINKTEWFATGFAGGNYGLGFTISFATFRWKRFFWETMRFQFAMLKSIDSHAINAKTMVGIPFFSGFANQHELRISTGVAGGYSSKDFSGDNNNWIEIDLSIPLEISYVFHADKYFAFQTGLIIDLPVLYHCHNEGYYLPVFSGFIGFRI